MTVGEKIKKIRTFRGMTQKELGLAVGFEEKGADNRIAQYETNYRVPKRELLDKIAQALRVESQNFYTLRPGCAEDFMRTFFGLVDEFMREWLLRQQELHAGEITREEYFEWKINWPCTCDDSKRFDYYVPWRKEK